MLETPATIGVPDTIALSVATSNIVGISHMFGSGIHCITRPWECLLGWTFVFSILGF